MDNRLVVAGIAGVVGLLLGFAVAPSGPDAEEISSALDGRFEQVSAEVQEVEDVAQEMLAGVVALDERLVALEAANAARDITLAAVAEDLSALIDERMAALGRELEKRAEESQAGTAAAMEILLAAARATASQPTETQTSGGQDDQSAMAPARSTGGQDDPAAASPFQATPVQEMGRDIAASMLYSAGQTARAGDGHLRAFVSRIDPEAQAAILFVNGTMTSLTPGEGVALEVDDQLCRVALLGIRDRNAALDVGCRPAS